MPRRNEPPIEHATRCEPRSAPGYLVNRANRAFTRAVDRDLRPLRITVAQLHPLFVLSEEGAMLQRDLVRRSPAGQPAMVQTLLRLERDGLIRRRTDERDRRAAIVELTPEGESAVATASSRLTEGNERATRGFSDEERATLVSLLERMAANLDEDR